MIMQNFFYRTARIITLTTIVGSIAFTGGCSLFRVYKIDLPQGTPITQSQAKRVQIGMNKGQVLYLLGNPAFKDTLESYRWDYIYDFEAGTFGDREGKPDIHNATHHLKIYFSGDKVIRIDGVQTLPVNRP